MLATETLVLSSTLSDKVGPLVASRCIAQLLQSWVDMATVHSHILVHRVLSEYRQDTVVSSCERIAQVN